MRRKPGFDETEIRKVLERVPKMERLDDSEREQMRNEFLRMIRRESGKSENVSPRETKWIPWFGLGIGFAVCSLWLFFVIQPSWKANRTPESLRRRIHLPAETDVKAFFHREQTESATNEVPSATEGIRAATRVLLNRVPPESLCGPRSLWTAAALVGRNLDLGELIRKAHVGPEGCSLFDLYQAAQAWDLNVRPKKLDWKSLLEQEGPVVLFVDGNHFSCLDPRERNSDSLRYYDPPNPACWISRSELEKKWKGECLVLNPQVPEEPDEPAIAFQTVFRDSGVVWDRASVEFSFPFRNVGKEVLEILSVEHSCGCLNAEPTQQKIPPGESGAIRVEMDLRGGSGTESQMVEVYTNAPAQPSLTLIVQATPRKSVVFSNHFVDFGEISPSVPSEKSLRLEIVSGNGNGGNLIFSASFDHSTPPVPEITFSVEPAASSRLFGTKEPPRSRRLCVRASVPGETSPGVYRGVFLVRKNPQTPPLERIPFQVTVAPDYVVMPEHVSFGVVGAGKRVERTVRIRARSEHLLRVEREEIVYQTGSGEIRPRVAAQLKDPVRETLPLMLTFETPEEFEDHGKSAVAKGVLVLYPEKGSVVKVPWSAIVKKGQY